MQEYIILNLTPAFLLFIVERKKKWPANSNNAKTELLILQIIMFVYTTAGWWRNNYAGMLYKQTAS